MARMQNLTVIITVMMMLLHSALTNKSLKCYNDYYNTFTCVWNTSNVQIQPPITPQTNCSLHVEVKKSRSSITEMQQMSMKGSDLNIRTASVEFKKPGGIIIDPATIFEKVMCENFDAPVAQTQHLGRDSVVKVLPPVGVKVDGLNVSWSFASPKSKYFAGHVFELQYRSAEQSWTDSKSVQINDPYIQLHEDHLYSHQPYVLRVRAKLLEKPNAIWSEWSSEYSWTSDVGEPHPTLNTGLECYNDYYNTFTCVWNTSNVQIQPPITPQTNCSLHVEVKKSRIRKTEMQQMSMKGSDLNIRTASVEFKTPGGIIINAVTIFEKVMCENFDAPVSQTQHKGEDSVVKVLPPVGVKVDGLNVSWSFASPKSKYFLGHVFELQYRSAEQSWMDSKSVQINDPHIQLHEDHLYLYQPYVLRVRAKLLEKLNAIWSEWSSEYSWTSDVGKPRPTPTMSYSLGALNPELGPSPPLSSTGQDQVLKHQVRVQKGPSWTQV